MDQNGGNSQKTSHLWNALSGKIMLSTTVILFSIMLLFIVFLHIYIRWHIRLCTSRRSKRRRRTLIFYGEFQPYSPSTSNCGFDPAVLKSLPMILFPSGAGDEDDQVECTIRLNEFLEEQVRRLPPCGHLFHADCIGMWLYAHSNCPLCRSAVEKVKEAAPPVADQTLARAEGSLQSVPCSSSSNSSGGELIIELPARWSGDKTVGEEQEASGSAGQILMWPNSRIEMVRWLLTREIRAICVWGSGEEPDLERREEVLVPI